MSISSFQKPSSLDDPHKCAFYVEAVDGLPDLREPIGFVI